MKALKGSVIAVLALIAAVGGFAVAGFLKQPARAPEQNTETQTEAHAEEETPPKATEALEHVTDENWDTMVHVYRIIMDKSVTVEDLVANGQPDPDDVVRRANEIIEYGKSCERDSLLNQKAEEVLRDMVDVADDMLTLIKEGGGEIIEVSSAKEVGQEGNEGAEEAGVEVESAEATETADAVGDTQGAEAEGGIKRNKNFCGIFAILSYS